jgi:hypothetical protein
LKAKILLARSEDIYKDIIRIPEKFRLDNRNRIIPEGSVCKMTVGGKSVFALARGIQGSCENEIQIDERLRNILSLNINDEVEIEFKMAKIPGQIRWAWNASDQAYRIAARLGVVSVILGGVGLMIAILSVIGLL